MVAAAASTIRSIFSAKSSAAVGAAGGIFETFFGGGATTDREGRQRGSDLRYDMQITLEEAAFGVEKEIEIRKLDTCSKCNGKGAEPARARSIARPAAAAVRSSVRADFFRSRKPVRAVAASARSSRNRVVSAMAKAASKTASRIKLKMPAGIADGSRLRSSGNGEAGIRGGPPGDLYVVIHVKEHEIFQREEDNLYCEVPIAFTLAALGGEIAVPTLEGKANLKVPAGTQSGQVFKLRGKGILNVNGRDRGDLLARLIVEVPTRLNHRAAPETRGIRRSLRRRKHASAQEFLRSRERIFSVKKLTIQVSGFGVQVSEKSSAFTV